MSGGVYGGDEVGALVLDVGSYTTRAGYAGEDTPKADIPTMMGVGLGTTPTSEAMETNATAPSPGPPPSKKYYIDSTYLYTPREGVEMVSPLKDGLSEFARVFPRVEPEVEPEVVRRMLNDWDLYQKLLDHLLSRHIRTTADLHPIMMTEAPWNTKQKRERLTELMFETYNIPAFFMCKTSVLSAFANGRTTALVVDSGATHTTVAPVHDGYALRGGVVRTPLGGDYVTVECRSFMEKEGIEIVPPYMIRSKEAVKEKMEPVWTKKDLPPLTQSYCSYMNNELLRDFQASVAQVSPTSLQYEIDQSSSIPTSYYEFPNGYNINLTVEKFKLTEGMFNAANLAGISGGDLLSIPNVVMNSASMCDTEIRPSLYSSLVVVGGNSLLPGFTERLSKELSHKTPPSIRVKLVQNSGSVERRYSSWIGGSILASLGTFQQMWISKQEYEDSGKNIVEKKCP